MSLFSVSEFTAVPEEIEVNASSADVGLNKISFLTGNRLDVIKSTIGQLNASNGLYFMTDGAWSNVQLLDYILTLTGPADVFFSTWSISADAIRCFSTWRDSGMIRTCFAILDQGIRNRKPEILQQASGCFQNLRLIKCHAKVMVISNDHYQVTVLGSANFTRNPRKEAGMIIMDKVLAEENIKWILEEFANE